MKILIIGNHQIGLYKFRRELLERLVSERYDVFISVPDGPFTDKIKAIGCKVIINGYMDRRGTNPVHEFQLFRHYKAILKELKPDLVFTYTIKPNVYGGYLCGKKRIPYIVNVTGLGSSIQHGGMLGRMALSLYRGGLKRAEKVFFQNNSNLTFMIDHGVVKNEKYALLPGSGVNTDQYSYKLYPDSSDGVVFSTIGRIMRDKGIEELLEAAEIIKQKHPETIFRLIGEFDEGYEERVSKYVARGIIQYVGFKEDVRDDIADSHAIIHASHHEGMSNVLLEAASIGRPVIATDIPGCIETFDPGVSGISFSPCNTESLVSAIEKFLSLSSRQWEDMGKAGRNKMELEFNRDIVIEKYMSEIRTIIRRKDNGFV